MSPSQSPSQIEKFITETPEYTSCYSGRGIVICGGGLRYFPGAWITIRTIRALGCNLPVELWYLNSSEVNEEMIQLLVPYGVECINFEKSNRDFARIAGGWELKPYAILHSSFKEVLYLDADNIPVRNPDYLFDDSNYIRTGAIFWPGFGKLLMENPAWSLFGLEPSEVTEFESGQIVVDKERCWTALNLTKRVNEHSEFYYKYFHGDKDTFLLSFIRVNKEYSLIDTAIHMLKYTICQHDSKGTRLFQHRVGWSRLNNSGKWSLRGRNYREDDFWMQNECFQYLKELRILWRGLKNKQINVTANIRSEPGYIHKFISLFNELINR